MFIITQGAMTNLASAIFLDKIVEEKLVCISIGGCNYPFGGFEFNYMNDVIAAETVMKSGIEVWQVPEEVYSTVQVGFAELYKKLRSYGQLGEYLFEHLKDVQVEMTHRVPKFPGISNHEYALSFPNGESWSLIYKNINSRFILEDFFAKMEYYFG